MKRALLYIWMITICLPVALNAQKIQKKPLTFDDLAGWKVITKSIVSNDGKLTVYELNPQKGDGCLVVRSTDGKKTDTLKRAYDARISPESDFVVFKIKQPQDSIRTAKKKKLKKEQMPKDSVGVMIVKTGKVHAFANVKEFAIPKENAQWVALMVDMPKAKKKEGEETKKAEEKEKAMADDKEKDPKSQLILLNSANGDSVSFKNVTSYYYAPLGSSVAFIRQTNDSLDAAEVMVFNTKKKNVHTLFKQTGTAKKVACDEKGLQYGFLFSTDTLKEKVYSLYYTTLATGEPKAVVTRSSKDMPLGWAPSDFSDLSFCENGKYLHFGTTFAPIAEPKDTLLEDEKPMLDIWSWKDKELQPEQKINLEKEKKRTYKAVYLIEKNQFVQLADPTVREVNTIQKGNGKVALGIDPMAYKLEASWDGRSTADYYLVDVETGAKRIIVKDKALVKLSPGGNYVVWYDPSDSTYYSKSTNPELTTVVDLSSKIPVSFYEEQWDTPEDPKPYGIAGWSENDKYVFLY
ncbi:MAG: hypothetical protein H7X84_06350, partial [Verrucomicrobia bacterium]|nr:hypothetical protein [Prolixibacteraceae bacterium]